MSGAVGGPGASPAVDRVVLITGATGALGRVAARTVAADGARLALAGTDHGRLAEVAAEAGVPDDRWVAAIGDLRDATATRTAVDAVIDRFGRVDVLLHLVGGFVPGAPILELDEDRLRSMLDQHLWTTLHAVRAVLPGMVERGWGRILAVTSFTTVTTPARAGIYATTKGAQETLLKVLAKECAGTGVTVNLVAVRAIDTKHVRDTEPDPKTAAWTTPEEIVATLRFLASDAAGRINGARIALDGQA